MFGLWHEETCELLLWIWDGTAHLGIVSPLCPDTHSKKGFAKHGPKGQPGIFSVCKFVLQDRDLFSARAVSVYAHLLTGRSLA